MRGGIMIVDLSELREKNRIFDDRPHAGRTLADMLKEYSGTDAVILAIPAGGLPVAASMARKLSLPLDVAVVSKITLPWTTEAGFGAVAFDGTVKLNDQLLPLTRLSEDQIHQRINQTAARVRSRLQNLRANRPALQLAGRTVILVDDGIASGFTMLTAVEAIKNQHAEKIIIAVPTAHSQALQPLDEQADLIYCANIRSSLSFAVADAYRKWYDVTESEAKKIIGQFGGSKVDSDRK